MNRLVFLLPTIFCACTASLRDDTFATGSRTMIASADHSALYVVDTDGGQVVRHDPAKGTATGIDVGAEPTRLALANGKIYVTLRAERAVAVLEDDGGTLKLVQTVQVGAEPYGVVAREDGTRLYVALSAQDQVVELDGETLEVTHTWDVSGHPAFLALHPSGKALYVGATVGGGITWIDLDDGGVFALDLPAIYGAGEDGSKQFTRRITGDFAAAPDGSSFAAPALFVDNDNPVADPGETEVQSDGYGSVGLGVSRFNPALSVIPTDNDGEPTANEAATVLVAGFAKLDEDQTTRAVRSYLSSATYSPDSSKIYAPMEASSTVAIVSARPIHPAAEQDTFFDTGGSFLSADQAGFATSPLVMVGTDAGPRGVAFLGDDDAFVHAWLDRSVADLRAHRVASKLDDQLEAGFAFGDSLKAKTGVEVMARAVDADVEAGRRLFFSATASQMAADGAGVSCSTCHFDGRNDGLTWTFEDGVRQTPSLAGAVSVTAPFTWTDEVESVSDEAQITSSGRMGGNGLSYVEAAQVAAYIESIRAVDVPGKGSTDAAVVRGKAIFERADVACATCHSGERLTDNEHYEMFGLAAVNTPTLVGIAATAPYLHDGSAATLEALLERVKDGEMGDTSMLSDDELRDLAAYLRSL